MIGMFLSKKRLYFEDKTWEQRHSEEGNATVEARDLAATAQTSEDGTQTECPNCGQWVYGFSQHFWRCRGRRGTGPTIVVRDFSDSCGDKKGVKNETYL